MSSKRKIHIDGEVWLYTVGRSFINIWSPEGQRTTTTECVLTGVDPDILERAYNKRYAKGVWPSEIKAYIKENLLEGRAV